MFCLHYVMKFLLSCNSSASFSDEWNVMSSFSAPDISYSSFFFGAQCVRMVRKIVISIIFMVRWLDLLSLIFLQLSLPRLHILNDNLKSQNLIFVYLFSWLQGRSRSTLSVTCAAEFLNFECHRERLR